MTGYWSIAHDGTGYYEEKKSEFLGFAYPVATEEDAIDHIREIRKKYSDARHCVYAYVLREQNKSRYTDDGEPSGTAGMPVLDCIRKSDLQDCLVIVVRYFGGTLLGTGGLVRAYTAAATDAIRDASVVEYRMMQDIEVCCSYNDYQKLLQAISSVFVDDTDFADMVRIQLHLPEECTEHFVDEVRDLTARRAEIAKKRTFFGI